MFIICLYAQQTIIKDKSQNKQILRDDCGNIQTIPSLSFAKIWRLFGESLRDLRGFCDKIVKINWIIIWERINSLNF